MTRVELGDLPSELAGHVHQFLYALFDAERGRYVVRHVSQDGRAEELEYDVSLGRLLTIDERRRDLPAEERVSLEGGLTAACRYFLEDETANLRVTIDVLDANGEKLGGVQKQVHDFTPWTIDEVAKEAIAHHSFPTLPKEERVRQWAWSLHRLRRAHGESGRDEDEIYDPGLLRDMEMRDPQVRDLLVEILSLVGRLEQTAPAQAIASFAARTGTPDVVFHRTSDLDFPWEGEWRGRTWLLRLGDFPAEDMWELFIDRESKGTFNDWPAAWTKTDPFTGT